MRQALRCILLLVLLNPTLWATGQDEGWTEIEVLVTSISGNNVYLDTGRNAGIQAGDTVLFAPLAAPQFQAVIDAVSNNSAQVDAGQGAELLSAGDRAFVRIPASRTQEAEEATDGGTKPNAVPEHPPWAEGPGEWDLSTPLLAPIESLAPEKRGSKISGRISHNFETTWDNQNQEQRYTSNRTGIDLRFDNPFGKADGIRLRTETFARTISIEDEPDEHESKWTIDRFSYFRGGQRTNPLRYEIGRFLPLEFPEFGLLDGGEISRRTGSGSIVGASLGLLPRPNDELQSDEDFQAAVYYKRPSTPEAPWSFAGGYQKSWHQGEPDRDLVVLKSDYTFESGLSFFGTAWIDAYTSSDRIKTSDVELTQLNLNSTYRSPAGHGASLFYTRVRFPELLRTEFQALTPEQIQENGIDRVSLSAWRKLSSRVRLNGRVDHWVDQDSSGENGEVRMDFRNYFYDRGNVSLAVFRLGGDFRSGIGARATATKSMPAGLFHISVNSTRFDQSLLFAEDALLYDHALRASYDWSPAGWDVSLFAEDRFGDSQDAVTLGFLIQKRF